MAGARDWPYYSGKHKCHGVNVQVIADPTGRLIWASPALPGARHDMGAAREHGIIDAISDAGVHTLADTAYQGGSPEIHRNAAAASTPPAATGTLLKNQKERQHRPRPPTRSGRAGQRRTEELEDPPQDPLQPEPGHHSCEGRSKR